MGASVAPTGVQSDPNIPPQYMTAEIRALTTRVSTTIPSSISITNATEYSAIHEAWLGEKDLLASIERSFEGTDQAPGPKKLSHMTHKSICKLENDLKTPCLQRIELYGNALAAYDDVQEQAALEAARQDTINATLEDANRREAEAAFLDQRADLEGRPELAERAGELREERRPLPSVASFKDVPATPGMRFAVALEPTCDQLEAFICAIARPKLLRMIAKTVRESLTNKKLSGARKEERALLVDMLETAAGEAIVIPCEAVEANLSFIKKLANSSESMGRQVAQWPGITLTRNKAPRKTPRR